MFLRDIRLSLLIFTVLIFVFPNDPGYASDQERPNVLLILTDDQGWGDITSHGNNQLETPNMDRLAAGGARFHRFFVSPLCAPTRASLLTGRYHLRTGVSWVTHRKEVMRGDEITLAEVFRDAGYRTGCFGKWHNGIQAPTDPNSQGFEQFVGLLGGGCSLYFNSPELYRDRQPWHPARKLGYITDLLTDEAIEFITRHRETDWLCYVPYNAPHTPCQVPDRYFDKYRGKGFDAATAAIYGMIENIDDNLGRLLVTLEATGQAQQTIVVFLSDNGPNGKRFNGGMKGTKGSVHEGGTRVPCFIRYPAEIAPGTVIDPLCAHIDLLPTLADLCGVELAAAGGLDGISIADLLVGKVSDLPERALYFHNSVSGLATFPGAVRTSRWRAVRLRGDWELYDMPADPNQERNLASDHPQTLNDLADEYQRWHREVTKELTERTPVPVGHTGVRLTELPTPESYQEGTVRFPNGPGWTTDWLSDWKSTDARIWWDLDVLEAGNYEVHLVYGCRADQVGSILRIECGGAVLEASVDTAFDPNVRRRPDRSSQVNRTVCDFTTVRLGTMPFAAGQQQLSIRAIKIPGNGVGEFRGLRLIKLP